MEKKLQLQGIEMRYKYKGQTSERQGVSFKIGENIFKGSKVDPQFSLGNLEKTLANNRRQQLDPKQDGRDNITSSVKKPVEENYDSSANQAESFPTLDLTKGIEKLVESLIKPEECSDHTPYELLKENRRKRKKQSSNHRGGLHH